MCRGFAGEFVFRAAGPECVAQTPEEAPHPSPLVQEPPVWR
jgi:hypothetical protein